MEMLRPGIVCIRLAGVLELELARDLLGLIDELHTSLEAAGLEAYLLLDGTLLERLSFQAQQMLLTRGRRNGRAIAGIHCVTTHPFFRMLMGLMQRIYAHAQLQVHADSGEALMAIESLLHPRSADPEDKGPELVEEAFDSEHAGMRYYRPRPEILLSESLGITNATAVHHMLDVHCRWLARQRREYGRAILIVDARGTRHCTMEAYRILSGELGEAGPKPNDIICVITKHWPKAVARLVQQLLRRLEFRLMVAGSVADALQQIAELQRRPQPVRRRKGRSGLKQQLAELQAENARLKAERTAIRDGVGTVLSDILLHKPASGIPPLAAAEQQPDFQEIYESLYLLQHDYQAYLQTLQQEIDERIQAEHRAAELSQVKSRFLGSVSHELRTPLNAIIGFTQLMLKGKGGELSPQQRTYLERVKDNSLHLLALINDVLDISRIESGTLALRLEDQPMAGFLERVLEPLRLNAARKRLPLELELDPQAPDVLLTDADRLRQIVSNLVSNAIKFTEAGQVTVRYRSWPHKPYLAAIEVQDTGIGIAKEDQKKIFEAFIQAHDGSYAGAGLGLSICLSLIYLLGYQIELESEPGAGALFRVLLTAMPETQVSLT